MTDFARKIMNAVARAKDMWLRDHVGHFAEVSDITPTHSVEWPSSGCVVRHLHCSRCDGEDFVFTISADAVGQDPIAAEVIRRVGVGL